MAPDPPDHRWKAPTGISSATKITTISAATRRERASDQSIATSPTSDAREDRRRRDDPVFLVEQQARAALDEELPADVVLRAVDHRRERRAPDPVEERHPERDADDHRHAQRERHADALPERDDRRRETCPRPRRPRRRRSSGARGGPARARRSPPSSASTCCSARAAAPAPCRRPRPARGAGRGRRAAWRSGRRPWRTPRPGSRDRR